MAASSQVTSISPFWMRVKSDPTIRVIRRVMMKTTPTIARPGSASTMPLNTQSAAVVNNWNMLSLQARVSGMRPNTAVSQK